MQNDATARQKQKFATSMRTRTYIVVTVLAVAAITVYNLRGNLSRLSTLPDHRLHHIDAARKEVENVPFLEREHRLERRPRLERAGETGASPIILPCFICNVTGIIQSLETAPCVSRSSEEDWGCGRWEIG